MSFDFRGRRVLVTGASRGIGYGIARAFARSGADLAIIADDAAVSEAGERLSAEAGNKVVAMVCDVTDRAAVARVVGGFGPLDVLVNNAGVERITPVLDPGEEIDRTFMRILDVNVNGSWHVTRAAVAGMRELAQRPLRRPTLLTNLALANAVSGGVAAVLVCGALVLLGDAGPDGLGTSELVALGVGIVLVAQVDRIGERLAWEPRYDDLATIVDQALRWERRLQGLRAA